MYRVEVVGAVRTVVVPPWVTVWPSEQEDTVVITTSVVIRSEVAVVDGAGVGDGAGVLEVIGAIEMLDGQLVMIPGFWGMKSPHTPTR